MNLKDYLKLKKSQELFEKRYVLFFGFNGMVRPN
jgi:hypothetical protein